MSWSLWGRNTVRQVGYGHVSWDGPCHQNRAVGESVDPATIHRVVGSWVVEPVVESFAQGSLGVVLGKVLAGRILRCLASFRLFCLMKWSPNLPSKSRRPTEPVEAGVGRVAQDCIGLACAVGVKRGNDPSSHATVSPHLGIVGQRAGGYELATRSSQYLLHCWVWVAAVVELV